MYKITPLQCIKDHLYSVSMSFENRFSFEKETGIQVKLTVIITLVQDFDHRNIKLKINENVKLPLIPCFDM